MFKVFFSDTDKCVDYAPPQCIQRIFKQMRSSVALFTFFQVQLKILLFFKSFYSITFLKEAFQLISEHYPRLSFSLKEHFYMEVTIIFPVYKIKYTSSLAGFFQ